MRSPFPLSRDEAVLVRKALGLLSGFALALTIFGGSAMYLTRLKQPVIVPKVIGMEQKDAERALNRKGLSMRSGRTMYDERIPAGSVVIQDPRANNYLKRGATVEVVLSRGKPRVPVPDVVHQTLRRAQNVLAQGQFRVGRRSYMSSGIVPKDTVMAQVPPAGDITPASSTVDLLVSTGPLDPIYVMPSLKRQSLEKAFRLLRPAAILIEKITTKVHDDLPIGTILAQSPAAGSRIEEKASVSLTVSTTSSEASLQPRLANFNFTMPEGPPRRLRIDVFDSTGTRTIYNKMEEPGNPVSFEIKVTGRATAQVYLGQQFEREVSLE